MADTNKNTVREYVKNLRNPSEPITNTLTKEEFENRVKMVFKTLEDVLSKSFGPYGSNTFIGDYPFVTTTKDGWSIMKNLLFADPMDRLVAGLAKDICGRLNNTVGDGTTSAIIATNSMYESYMKFKHNFSSDVNPRDILRIFRECGDRIIKHLCDHYVAPVNPDDPNFVDTIRNIVYISSNGDEMITDMISELYSELKYPALDIVISPDGVTRSKIINGFSCDTTLTDKLYINNDNNTAVYDNVAVIMFDHKVGNDTYLNILKPLNELCRAQNRHLIVIAPFYDEKALSGQIKNDLLTEYHRNNKDINMVLTVCASRTAYDKKRISDLAMLLNTLLITVTDEEDIIKAYKETGLSISSIISIDCLNKDIPDNCKMRLGNSKYVEIGLKQSVFRGFDYDESLYNVHIKEAESELKEATDKYKAMGTFNLDISWARQRLYSLKLKMGSIEVGGDSELSQGLLRDAVDDAVKAATSAFNNGVVAGCHINLVNSIDDLMKESGHQDEIISPDYIADDDESITQLVYHIIGNAFINVYDCVFRNKYGSNRERYDNTIKTCYEKKIPYDIVKEAFSYNNEIITSVETDIQILKATIDLISLLISGNQFLYLHLHGEEF